MTEKKRTTFWEMVEEITPTINLLKLEKDRGAILAAAAFLDDFLGAMLQARFVDKSSIIGNLLGTDRPLGTFSSRIDICYCLGILETREFNDLHTCRKMRNEAAHSRSAVSFEESPYRDFCSNLQLLQYFKDNRAVLPVEAEEYVSRAFGDLRNSKRDFFIASVSGLFMMLLCRHAEYHFTVGEGRLPEEPVTGKRGGIKESGVDSG